MADVVVGACFSPRHKSDRDGGGGFRVVASGLGQVLRGACWWAGLRQESGLE